MQHLVIAIPPGQNSVLLEEIRLSAAGTAAGTAVDLAKLGAHVVAMGAIGADDIGGMLVSLLDRHGVDTGRLVRVAGVQTSATMLPIRPNGERPALHVPGATPHLQLAPAHPRRRPAGQGRRRYPRRHVRASERGPADWPRICAPKSGWWFGSVLTPVF